MSLGQSILERSGSGFERTHAGTQGDKSVHVIGQVSP
jgi:hypothetical protein